VSHTALTDELLNLPAGHSSQPSDPALTWYCPAVHSSHAMAAASETNFPVWQLLHASDASSMYVPAWHGEHEPDPTALKCPAAQAVHSALEAVLNRPTPHEVQTVRSNVLL